MKATFEATEPMERLLDQLVDGLYLLYECRSRGVSNLDRLLEYLEYTMDEIERRHLGMSSDLYLTLIEAGDANETIQSQPAATPAKVLAMEDYLARN